MGYSEVGNEQVLGGRGLANAKPQHVGARRTKVMLMDVS